MVRTLIKGLLVLLVIVGVSPFILPLKDGRPLLSFSDLKAPALPRLPEMNLPARGAEDESAGNGAPPGVVVYRWKDAEGKWAYSNEAPPPNVSYETIVAEIDPAPANADSTFKAPAVPPPSRSGDTAAVPSPAESEQMPSPYSPEQVKKLLEDARGIQELLDARKERLEGQN